jgi:hypothetical protein
MNNFMNAGGAFGVVWAETGAVPIRPASNTAPALEMHVHISCPYSGWQADYAAACSLGW